MSTKFELPFDTCFACFQKSDDNCSCKSRKIYEQGKADAEKRYQLEYDRQIDNEQEAFENGYDKGYEQGKADALNIDLDTPMHFTPEQKAWIKKYIISNGQANYERGAREFAEWAEEKGYFDDYHAPFLRDMLAEWQKEVKNG